MLTPIIYNVEDCAPGYIREQINNLLVEALKKYKTTELTIHCDVDSMLLLEGHTTFQRTQQAGKGKITVATCVINIILDFNLPPDVKIVCKEDVILK